MINSARKTAFLFILLVSISLQGLVRFEKGNQSRSLQSKIDKNVTKSPILFPDYGRIPLYFVPNEGQVDERVLFYAKTLRYHLWLTEEGLFFDSMRRVKKDDNESRHSHPKHRLQPEYSAYERDVSRLLFLNAHKNPAVYPLDCAYYKVNYFVGNDISKWRTNIQASRVVLYNELYDKIDMKIYGVEEEIEYDFVVRPGGDVSDIQFEYKDVKGTRIDESGHLLIDTRFGELMHKKPECYQVIGGERFEVEAAFMGMGTNTYGFEVEEYDRDYELIIDPMVIVFSTYMGGSGDDEGFDVAVNAAGEVYVTGDTMSLDFPIINPMQEIFAGNRDIFVKKISSDGTALLYSTYLGGSDWDWTPSIAVDNEGAVYITGSTESVDFPTMNPYQGNNAGRGADIFVTKINASGTDLIYSTYLGGSICSKWDDGPHDYGFGIAVDSEGAAYVTGETWSYDFPIKNAIEGWPGGGGDSFVTKINPRGTDLVYSTYLPVCAAASGWDASFGIAVDSEGAAYVTGVETCDYPSGHPEDVFVMKIRPDGTGPAIRLGDGPLHLNSEQARLNMAQGRDIAVDVRSAVYVVGETGQRTKDRDAFIRKIDSTGKREYYFRLYGSRDEHAYAISVDSKGAAYVTGSTNSVDFQTVNPLQESRAGGSDAFVVKVSPAGEELEYSSYLGGARGDAGRGIAAGANGVAYIVGATNSINFPIKNPIQANNAGSSDAFVTKLCFSTYSLEVEAGIGGSTDPSPGYYDICAGSEIIVEAIPNEGFGFSHWSGDATGKDNPVIVVMDADKSIKANFVNQYALNISAGAGGTTDPAPGTHMYDKGIKVTITGIPDIDFRFSHWSGDIGGRTNPKTKTVNTDLSIVANFNRIIYPPLNLSGEKVLNRAFIVSEYINVLRWRANPENVGVVKYRIFQMDLETQSLVAEVDASTFEYWHRSVEGDRSYTYSLVGVNSEGLEGDPAYVTVN